MSAQATYTVGDLITRVRTLIDEPTASNSYVSDAQIIYFLNLAQADINREIKCNPTSTTIAGSSFDSNKEYSLASVPVQIDLVTIGTRKLRATRFEDKQWINGWAPDLANPPVAEGYYLRGNKLGVPSVASADTVTLYYCDQLTELTSNSDTPTVPAYCNNALINYAVARCKLKDDDKDGATFWMSLYADELQKSASLYKSMQTQAGRVVLVC